MIEHAFLQAIIESPEDDTPRLVYADWLEDHGQPERAELIRVQCQEALLVPGDERRPQLREQALALERAHIREWLGPVREHLGGLEPYFERGFPRFVGVSIARFASRPFQEMAAEWFPRAGVMNLRIGNSSGGANPSRFFPAIATSSFLEGLHTLSLWKVRPGDDGLLLLLSSPHLAHLRELEVVLPHCSDNGLRTLATAAALQGVRALTLAGTCWGQARVTVNGLRALLGTAHLPQLTTLRLPDSAWSLEGEQGREFVELPGLARLRCLDLWSNLIGDEGADNLAGSRLLTGLTELRLGRNHITQRGAQTLLDSPFLKGLRRLDLSENRRMPAAILELLRSRSGEA